MVTLAMQTLMHSHTSTAMGVCRQRFILESALPHADAGDSDDDSDSDDDGEGDWLGGEQEDLVMHEEGDGGDVVDMLDPQSLMGAVKVNPKSRGRRADGMDDDSDSDSDDPMGGVTVRPLLLPSLHKCHRNTKGAL